MTAVAPAQVPSIQTGSIMPDVIRSEWLKFKSVRSTYWTLAAAVIVMLLFAIVGCLVVNHQYPKFTPADRASFEPISFSLNGGIIAQLAVGVLGVLFITGEYSSGLVRTSLTAVPQRTKLVVAKIVVLALSVYVVMQIVSLASFLIGQALLHNTGIAKGLGDPGALRMVIGGGLYLMVSALFGMSIGLMIRHTGGSVAALAGLIFVLPGLLQLIPEPSRDTVGKYVPSSAGAALFNLHTDSTTLSPWVGFAVFTGWVALIFALAIRMLNKRDA